MQWIEQMEMIKPKANTIRIQRNDKNKNLKLKFVVYYVH